MAFTKKDLLEIVLIGGGLALLFATGMQAELAGFMQRMLLATGIQNANAPAEVVAAESQAASYEIQLLGLDGKGVHLSEMKGKTVFLNFWATWCPPCIAEMPSIQKLYENTDREKVAFVLVSTDEEMAKIKKFMERKGFTFPVYQLASGLPAAYPVRSIPATFILSPQGEIVYTHTGMANYDNEEFRQFLEGLQ